MKRTFSAIVLIMGLAFILTPPAFSQDPPPEEPPIVPFTFDIKPGTCVNPLNVWSKGVTPAVILGSTEVDFAVIDPNSFLAGILVSCTYIDKQTGALVTVQDVPLPEGAIRRFKLEEVVVSELDLDDECLPADPDGDGIPGDGIPDLKLKLDTQALADALGLKNAATKTEATITLSAEVSVTDESGNEVTTLFESQPETIRIINNKKVRTAL